MNWSSNTNDSIAAWIQAVLHKVEGDWGTPAIGIAAPTGWITSSGERAQN